MSRPKGKNKKSSLSNKANQTGSAPAGKAKTRQQAARGCVIRGAVIIVAIFAIAFLIYSNFN